MKRKNLIQRMTMPLPELEVYYRQRRQESFEKNEPFRGVKIRKALHPVLVYGLKVLHFLGGQKVAIIGNKSVPTNRPVIYAGTHIGYDDIEMIFSAIKDHAYLFWGDPNKLYKEMDGFLLDLNGTVICDTEHKSDRHVAKETAVRWLKQGGTLLIFPEGEWNITESKLVMYLYYGTAEMAIRTGADIIPFAIEQFGKEYRVNIGENIEVSNWKLEDKHMLTDYLRQVLATLKWEIIETGPVIKRRNLPENAREAHQQSFVDQSKGMYTWKKLCDSCFCPRDITIPEEAFAYRDKLKPSHQNAFLFRNRN